MASSGKVKYVNSADGYSYLTDDTGEDFGFNFTDVVDGSGASLRKDDRVEFDLRGGRGKPRAVNVRRAGAAVPPRAVREQRVRADVPTEEESGIELPNGLLAFAKHFSRHKTPDRRSSGAKESRKQTRGEPDWIDTVASVMLWDRLAEAGLPVPFHLTGKSGDQTDLRVGLKGVKGYVDINVKGTKSEFKGNPRSVREYGRVPVKTEEVGIKVDEVERATKDTTYPVATLRIRVAEQKPEVFAIRQGDEMIRKPLAHIYVKVFVHETPVDARCMQPPHVHFCNWIDARTPEFQRALDDYVASIGRRDPTMIPGIDYPGLWIPSNMCRPITGLIKHIRAELGLPAPDGT